MMRDANTRFVVKAMCFGIVIWWPALALATPDSNFEAAWAQLKTLAGTWDSHIVGEEEGRDIISYHVTSSGSVLIEEFIGNTPDGVRDMATVYHLDDRDLVATHYCGMGNQPRMKAVSYDPEVRVLRFDFWDITHLPDPSVYHTTNIELHFQDRDNIELRFLGTEAGVQESEWQVHRLRRLTSRDHRSD